MKFILRIGINAVSCYFLIILSYYVIMGVFASSGLISILLQVTISIAVLYIMNTFFNNIPFLKLMIVKAGWSITLGIFIMGAYFLCKAYLYMYEYESIIYEFFYIECFVMAGLSFVLNIIFKKYNKAGSCQTKP